MNLKVIIGICTLIVILVGVFFGLATQIEWTVYIGIFLVIVAGSAGVAFIIKRFEAIICGLIIGALLPVMIEAIKMAGST